MAFSLPLSLVIVSCVLPWFFLAAVRTKQQGPARLPLPPPTHTPHPHPRDSRPRHVPQLHVAVAYAAEHEAVVARAVNRTLAALTAELSAVGLSLAPVFTPLPPTFAAPHLARLASAWAGHTLLAVLIFAPEVPGRLPALAAAASNLPVIWTSGEVRHGYLSREPLGPLEVWLDAGIHDLFRGLRSLLLATHWHTFTLIHTGLPLRREVANILRAPPLLPKFIPLRHDAARHAIFRLLSEVSHSTKGVVLLMCDGGAAKRVMDEAQKLNMLQGNFVWLWIDTSATITAKNDSKLSIFYPPMAPYDEGSKGKERRIRESGDSDRTAMNEDHISFILKYLVGERYVMNNSMTNTSFVGSRNNNSGTLLSNSKESLNTTLLDNDTSESIIVNVYNTSENRSNFSKSIYSDIEVTKNISSFRKINAQVSETSGANKLNESLKQASDSLKQASSSNSAHKTTSSLDEYIWIPNKRIFWNSESLPKSHFLDLVQNLQLPLNVFESSNISVFVERLGNQSNNTSDSRLSKRKKVTRAVKTKANESSAREQVPPLPVGVLGIRALPLRFDRHLVRSAVRLLVEAVRRTLYRKCHQDHRNYSSLSCWDSSPAWQKNFSHQLVRELRAEPEHYNASSDKMDRVLAPRFQILNLVPESTQVLMEDLETRSVQESITWRTVGDIVGQSVHLDTVVWPGGDLVPVSTARGVRSVFRVVTSLAPPFVMEGELDEDGQCLRGLECHRLLTSDKDNLTLVFNEMERLEDAEEESEVPDKDFWAKDIFQNSRYKFRTNCCYGLSMDLLENVAEELEFDFHLYIVSDEAYGSRVVHNNGDIKWNGIVGDLVSGAAHMSFAALSVSSPRSQVIDFSVPYFFSGVSFLAAPKQRTDIPLLAFLLPFSPELWIAIFTSLNVTAVAVAIYEWLSPFGLNPWGRQRSKNFSMSSALWVCWGLLCGHLVAFKAPKSWPNKFLINVWGGFSVIFVASYTANIAALIAGLFFHNAVGDYHDRSLLSQRVGTPRASAADYYVHRANQVLWEHMQRYSVKDVASGVQHLKNGSLDILIADTPILDYYRATDHGCKLQKIGDAINEDTYAVGMTKGFPLKDSISAVIAKYSSNGYMDILQEKWYGGLPCFKLATDMAQPRPLGVAAVTGVFLLLGMGMVVGILILIIEHLFYRYTLPILRHKPKGTMWRSRNVMFFSQKLYRFINCVELVSPHHAARELVHTLRQGQITSLFQKSVKRKEHEQRRRRKSKAQFFEMIQEIRRVQQEEKVNPSPLTLAVPEIKSPRSSKDASDPNRRHSRLSLARRLSKEVFRSKSSSNLSIRRLSSDINMAAGRFLDCHASQAIGRRLSRDTNLSPPDINSRRASHLSIGRKPSSQLLSPSDVDSSSDVSAPPRSPNLLDSGIKSPNLLLPTNSLRLLPTLPNSPDYKSAATRFRYVDVKSPTFRTKLSRFKEPTQEESPKVVVHQDNTDTMRASPQPQTEADNEHLIEIVIPSEDRQLERLNSPGETLQTSRSLTGLSILEQISTLSDNRTLPQPPSKPKIVSYLPKKHRKLSTEVGHRRVNGLLQAEIPFLQETMEPAAAEMPVCQDITPLTPSEEPDLQDNNTRTPIEEPEFHEENKVLSRAQGKSRKRACSDSILRAEEVKIEANPVVENCEVFSLSGSSGDVHKTESSVLSRLSKAELMSLSQIPEQELKRKLMEAIQDRDPT